MKDSEEIKAPLLRLGRYIWAVAVVWTLVIAASLVWNMFLKKGDILAERRTRARVAYEKDVIYRRWNAVHAGVYVPVTEETQPNPYLSDVPERDITTPSGKRLTLINPAYMTRQVHELAKEKYGIRGHITSMNPIRPENAPDPWEAEALRAFERGVTETSSVGQIEGKEYMRLMRPLITEKGCLKCHAKQGYHEGDIRGGISISIPMGPVRAIVRQHFLTFMLVHGLLWLVGLSGIALGIQWLRRSERRRKQAEEEVQKAFQLNSILLDSIPNPAMLIWPDRSVIAANKIALEIGANVGDPCWREFGKSQFIRDGENKCWFCMADKAMDENEGKYCEVEAFGRLWETWWVPVGEDMYLHYLIDITERKQAEEEQKKRLEELERFRKATIDREFRMKELQEEIERLKAEKRR